MESFIFAINSTMPVFFVIIIGKLLRRLNIINDEWVKISDRLTFKIALPAVLFLDIATMEKVGSSSISFVLFCMIITTITFFGIWLISSFILKDKTQVGAFTQGAARSSAAILGIPFIQNIYGDSGLVPLMILAAVPLFNAYSVIILTFSSKANIAKKGIKIDYKKIILSILKNPLIIGIFLGFPFFFFNIGIPNIMYKSINTISKLAIPLMLLSIGADFKMDDLSSNFKLTLSASLIKLVILPLVVIPLALFFGIKEDGLLAILIMVGAPTAISGYIMAKNMDNDYVLMSNIVVMTTLMASVTFTFWLFILRLLKLI